MDVGNRVIEVEVFRIIDGQRRVYRYEVPANCNRIGVDIDGIIGDAWGIVDAPGDFLRHEGVLTEIADGTLTG